MAGLFDQFEASKKSGKKKRKTVKEMYAAKAAEIQEKVPAGVKVYRFRQATTYVRLGSTPFW